FAARKPDDGRDGDLDASSSYLIPKDSLRMTRTIASLLAGAALSTAVPTLAQHDDHAAPEAEPDGHGAMDHGSMDHGTASQPAVDEGHAEHDPPITVMTALPRHFSGCRSVSFDMGNSTTYGSACRPGDGSGTARIPAYD